MWEDLFDVSEYEGELDILPDHPLAMLASRRAVARLSKRALNSARQTNAFFASAALPRQAQSPSPLPRPHPLQTSTPGAPFSLVDSPVFLIFFPSSPLLCHRGQGLHGPCKNSHWCRSRRPV